MGINGKSHDMICKGIEMLKDRIFMDFLMLGNQHLRPMFAKRMRTTNPVAVDFYTKKYRHVFDKVHDCDIDGSPVNLKIDLGEDQSEYYNRYDLLFNGGTLEHVPNQLMAWQNADGFLRSGGIAVHVCTGDGDWPKPPPYLFNRQWFEDFCAGYNYTLIEVDVVRFKRGEVIYAMVQKWE